MELVDVARMLVGAQCVVLMQDLDVHRLKKNGYELKK